jgi:multidrug resistance efflux pump
MNLVRNIPWSKIGIALAAAVLLFFVVRTVRAGAPTAPNAKDAEHASRVIPSSIKTDPHRVAGNGIVEPAGRESKLAGRAAGVVARLAVSEGDYVPEGAVLVELESASERAAVATAEAEVALASAELTRTTRGLRREDVDAVVAEADAAKARADLNATSLARTEQLAKSGAMTADDLDRARQQSKDSDALARASDARRRAAIAGSRSEDVVVGGGRLISARARLEEARARLAQMTIRAPHAGEVLQVKLRTGELYTPGSGPIVVIGDTKKLQVRMDVDERDVAAVKLGANAIVKADALGAKEIHGKVTELGRRMGRKNVRSDDPVERVDTKILEVVVELENADGLVPGLRVVSYVDR